MRTAVYAGSFDPPTNGHLWMVERGLEMFDRLVVAIGDNPNKSYTFSIPERLDLLKRSFPACERLTVTHFDNRYLVDYAVEHDARFILRGIRSQADYEYERMMRHVNYDMAPDITTVFLMPPRDIAEVSSSMVKNLIGPEGWRDTVHRYVPPPVFDALEEKLGE
ncbi:pantetheine-phosphate adenylyltransferase [Haloferula sp. A504]|jgi:pantetheine-phosphate adenylyltransferase|uniref:pantetheine-phosphate adenylyltransferase n=1 Tax=Haloferula sp. A504 TaxID=3373601 RepID=UPI0037B24B28